ncbi:NAD(P)-dependent dehydrogenase, short-chain alcohol dehydrogenase family [Catalinimonas alkaloidigena]|uniref:NAD(P)-dependent dehydrogenase, short-chain alcohol dehydrogenase family n=1 Tax=Catalinimonas alkaloidigena TaxID=1075417 RepID=A0A1G9GB11_9BACT|nr:SDR family oxidoreductase [Catalinimonas alkaloidigena]SDK97473.1 NAD(P)-dependent dehydrogenase, short-chain alcohol dehydrogenase family [Catalinimonas alkaloidigena]
MENVLLVTGASRGIGAATAVLAAQRGYRVCVNYRQDHAAAQSVVDTIRRRGGKAEAFAADVSSETDVRSLFQTLDRQVGRLTALVNNAGTLETQQRVEAMEAARWHRLWQTNVLSCFLCTREAIHRMSTRRGGAGGAIVNVSSLAALTGAPHEYVDYAASKAAVEAFTRGLAHEVAAEGIRVNGVRPAFIHTDIHARGGEPDRIERIKPHIPLQRGGQPEEVARAILWLLSDEASYSTGTFLDVTGGK